MTTRTMTPTGHCRHCDHECSGERDGRHEYCDGLVTWQDGYCLACWEAARIADEADRRAQRVRAERAHYYDDRDVRAEAYEHMAEFARGEA